MSTSHYSRTDYTSPSRTDDLPEPGMREMREAVYNWENSLSHPSLPQSRPESTDAGADTIRLYQRVPLPQNTRRSTMPKLFALLIGGVFLLLLDGCAIIEYADSAVEATIISLATMPAAGFLIATAIQIRNLL